MCQGGLSGVDERMAAREAQGGTGCCFFAHGVGKRGGGRRDGVRGMGGYVRLGQRLWSKGALLCVHVTLHAPDACFSESFSYRYLV